jgi:hypothetical protein
MNRLITDNDRAYILEQLATATDDVLVDAFLKLQSTREKAVTARALIGKTDYSAPSVAEPVLPVERQNVNPGIPGIGKIGSATKDELLKQLAAGKQPAAKFVEHMKLLWERGEVKFDGKEWWS